MHRLVYSPHMGPWCQAIFLGIVEGITEFIPVSSTGHLILTQSLFHLDAIRNDSFHIAIQLGAILAVLWLYRDFFWGMLKSNNGAKQRWGILIVATLPALISGALCYSYIKALFSPLVVACSLGVGGVIMLLVEKGLKPVPTTRLLDKITLRQAFIVGIAQCAALIPGTSRSGATIVGGLIAKLDYASAASFSFILAVPIMVAAVGYDLLRSLNTLSLNDFKLIAVGLITAFIVASLSIKFLIAVLPKSKLFPFAIYRIVVSFLLLLVLVN